MVMWKLSARMLHISERIPSRISDGALRWYPSLNRIDPWPSERFHGASALSMR